MLHNFKIPKERLGGTYEIKCMISAVNPTTGEAHIYGEFERVKQTVLERALARHGATSIGIDPLTLQDHRTSGSALKFVETKASEPGFQRIGKGTPSVIPVSIGEAFSGADPFPVDTIKSLEQQLDRVEERAQNLEEELDLKKEGLRLSNDANLELVSSSLFLHRLKIYWRWV